MLFAAFYIAIGINGYNATGSLPALVFCLVLAAFVLIGSIRVYLDG